jgi:hypothetical protein
MKLIKKKKQKKKPINNEYPLEEKRKTNKERKDSYEQHNNLRTACTHNFTEI